MPFLQHKKNSSNLKLQNVGGHVSSGVIIVVEIK